MQVITVGANKGGAGKSTVTANLAGAFAQAGQRVCVIDLDPQGGASTLLLPDRPKPGPSLFDSRTSITPRICEQTTYGISVLPAHVSLASAELSLPRMAGWQDALRIKVVEAARHNFWDLVLIDSAPGLGVLPIVALRAARQFLIVSPLEFLSLRTIGTAIQTAERATVPVLGIVPMRVRMQTLIARQVWSSMREHYDDLLLSPIPERTIIQEAGVNGEPVVSYAPMSDAAKAFQRLRKEINE